MRRKPRPLLAAALLVIFLLLAFVLVPQGRAAEPVNKPWFYVLAAQLGTVKAYRVSEDHYATKALCQAAWREQMDRLEVIGAQLLGARCLVEGIAA